MSILKLSDLCIKNTLCIAYAFKIKPEEYTREDRNTEKYTGEQRRTQKYTGELRWTQEYRGEHRSTQENRGVHMGYRGQLRNTEVLPLVYLLPVHCQGVTVQTYANFFSILPPQCFNVGIVVQVKGHFSLSYQGLVNVQGRCWDFYPEFHVFFK